MSSSSHVESFNPYKPVHQTSNRAQECRRPARSSCLSPRQINRVKIASKNTANSKQTAKKMSMAQMMALSNQPQSMSKRHSTSAHCVERKSSDGTAFDHNTVAQMLATKQSSV